MTAPSRSPAGPPVVLVVDDVSAVRRALCRLLRTAGYEAKELATAGELLAQDGSAALAGIVLDVHLPDMNGLLALQRIRESHPELPVVIITADGDPELRVRALREGATAFLTKPIEEVELLGALRCLLDPSGSRAPAEDERTARSATG